jgi:hypothetical protein
MREEMVKNATEWIDSKKDEHGSHYQCHKCYIEFGLTQYEQGIADGREAERSRIKGLLHQWEQSSLGSTDILGELDKELNS